MQICISQTGEASNQTNRQYLFICIQLLVIKKKKKKKKKKGVCIYLRDTAEEVGKELFKNATLRSPKALCISHYTINLAEYWIAGGGGGGQSMVLVMI